MTDNSGPKLTNQAGFMGSVFYNVNSMLGWILGAPTGQQIALYSDLLHGPNSTLIDYVTSEVVSNAPTDASNALTYDNTIYIHTLSEEEYHQGDWFLFGQSWLPWFPPPPDGQGGYVKRNNYNDVMMFNKARMDVLMPTMMSVGKLAGIGIGIYFAGKYGYKYLNRRRR